MKRLFSLLMSIGFLMALSNPVVASEITLTMSDQNPETGWSSVHATLPWIKKLESATNGRVKIQPYFSQTLSKGKDVWSAVHNGIADMGWCAHNYWPGMSEMASVVTLPGLEIESAEQGSALLWKLYEKFPEVREGFKDNHVLLFFTSSPYYLISREKPIKTVADLNGMKIRTFGAQQANQMKALNATPIAIPMPDTYVSLQKGVVDGMATPWEPLYSFRLYEVAPYLTYAPVNVCFFSVIMNKAKWNSLSADLQEAISKVSGLEGSKFFGKNMFDSGRKEVLAKAKEAGKPISEYYFSSGDQKVWVEKGGKPLWDEWVVKMKAKGYTKADEILAYVLEMLK